MEVSAATPFVGGAVIVEPNSQQGARTPAVGILKGHNSAGSLAEVPVVT